MMKEFLGKTKNGFDIYMETELSRATTHFAKQPTLLEAFKKVISLVEVTGEIFRTDIDTGEIVGASSLVETTEQDDILYAKRPLRTEYSRFVKNKEPILTNWITIDLRKNSDIYDLYTCFIGKLTPSFPGGDYLPEQSKNFWSKHALVWGSQEVVPGTETANCPW